ncbi:type VI secretion system baseplate subunit TssG [Cupriavidus pauculus]|uniref:type VI secretion system baseplate subunit TssG n=1 Tax=Cupriavidus pauculus TaxID=82633 RepID=UPI0007833FFE|nr:type VI secretion system baseplate subunit TssG [Cupriavidus pauculus]MBY4729550.1 type VI secretion system baseplate subunit TssG [Cupriavidus pauculus]
MRSTKRRIDPSVMRRLLTQPHRFHFFQAVRLLQNQFAREARTPSALGEASGIDGVDVVDGAEVPRQRAASPEHVLATRVRFPNTLRLSFPPSEIESLQAPGLPPDALDDDAAFADAVAAGKLDSVALTPAFFGMLGAQGALPLHYTEIVMERESVRRDRAPRAFFDIFSHRAAALFYLAWQKYRLPMQHEIDRTRHYLPLLLSLGGIGERAARADLHEAPGTIHDEALAGYATALRHRPVSAAYLGRVLADYFRVPIRIEQFVGGWYNVPPAQLSQLGLGNNVLGATALAGTRVWQRDLRARVWIGPLARADYRRFLPDAPDAQALRKMMTVLGGATLEYEVRLVLRKEDVGGSVLGGAGGGRVGFDTFLATRPAERDRDDAHYTLQPVH